MTPFAALLAAGVVAGGGWMLRWLTPGGAVTATLLGTAVLTIGGLPPALLLVEFFLTGSLLTAANRQRAAAPRGRTARQVLANGWTAALGVLWMPASPAAGWAIVAGGLAAAQADTWATEIGLRSRRPPRLLVSGTPVPAGTSGGVTGLGSVGGALGAAAMAATAACFIPLPLAGTAGIAGVAGMLADSLLGGTVQGVYRCDRCAEPGEHPVHRCGAPARRTRGYRWIDNDVVNLLGTGAGAGVALGLATWLW